MNMGHLSNSDFCVQLRVAELIRPAATVAPLVAVAMARGGRGSRVLLHRLSRILGQPACAPVRLVNPWPLAAALTVCLGAALICGSAGGFRALAQDDSAEAAPLSNGNEPTTGAADERKDAKVAPQETVGLTIRINPKPVQKQPAPGASKEGPAEGGPVQIELLEGGLDGPIIVNRGSSFGASSEESDVEAFLTRVETPPPPRRGRISRHSRNEQGNIVALRLEGITLQQDDFALIGQLRELESLNLRRSNVTDNDLRPLAGLRKLRELKLGDTRLDGSGLEHLCGLERLERLELGDTEVTDDSLRHLTKLRNLHHLSLTSTRIGDSGVAHLARITSLQSLKLTYTEVTDEGLRLLLGLKELRGLTLDETKVTEAGLKSLAELPRFAWAASATATAEEFVGRIVRSNYEAVGEMYAVGLYIPDRGRFDLEKLDPIPPSPADQARGRRRFHVEMHWTVEAEKLDTTFFADFAVDRAAIIVQEVGIREKTNATAPSAESSQDRRSPEKGIMEGTVLDVLPDGMINILLGSDDGLKVGDTTQNRVLQLGIPPRG